MSEFLTYAIGKAHDCTTYKQQKSFFHYFSLWIEILQSAFMILHWYSIKKITSYIQCRLSKNFKFLYFPLDLEPLSSFTISFWFYFKESVCKKSVMIGLLNLSILMKRVPNPKMRKGAITAIGIPLWVRTLSLHLIKSRLMGKNNIIPFDFSVASRIFAFSGSIFNKA